jgi:integrase
VQGVRLHDLRHTFATLQLSAGVHFTVVSKWLGHSTFTLTLDVAAAGNTGTNPW